MGNRAGSQRLIQLGERIRQKRKDSHLSQETFAEKAGISVNTVSRIEGGQAAMSVEIFAKLVEVLDTDADELLGRRAKETLMNCWGEGQRKKRMIRWKQRLPVSGG